MEFGERDIIQAAMAGDPESFEWLMKAYSLRVFAIAYAILQDRPEAEDCAQDAFLKAWRARRAVREPEKFAAWLLTITRHAARDRLRRRAARPATIPLYPEDDDQIPAETRQVTAASREDEAEHQHQRVHVLLSGLPERHRTALSLRYLEGLDYRGIEQAMNLSNGALRGILARALETMRRGLRTTAAAAVATSPSTYSDAR